MPSSVYIVRGGIYTFASGAKALFPADVCNRAVDRFEQAVEARNSSARGLTRKTVRLEQFSINQSLSAFSSNAI
jgi:hypothetical protein